MTGVQAKIQVIQGLYGPFAESSYARVVLAAERIAMKL